MVLLILAFLAGALTIVSPCILPVLPFVFARADQPFLRSGLPLLLGMGVTFAAVATLAAVGGGWAVHANSYGRAIALAVLALFGLLLLLPELAERLSRPLVVIGSRLSSSADDSSGGSGSTFWTSFVLGISTGLLWAPCAGPILGLILTGAALQGASARTSLLLFAYAAGAATSLALALLVGGRVFAAMKRTIKTGERMRRVLGVFVLGGVLAIAFGLDTGFLTRLSRNRTASIEQSLLNRFHVPAQPDPPASRSSQATLTGEGQLPSLDGAVEWINSPKLSAEALRGKVVLIDFWTYSCINCLRSLPYIEAWAEKYKDKGLVVIGIHSPEFAFEKDLGNVRRAVQDLDVKYPVAVDNNFTLWRAFRNQYWPAHYFVDGEGRIRHRHFGEGEYAESEGVIRKLLAENGADLTAVAPVTVNPRGIQAAASGRAVWSPETYVGYARAENFANPGGFVRDQSHRYKAVPLTAVNEWALDGDWSVEKERAVSTLPNARIAFRFHARDLHLVLSPAAAKPVRFRVRLDGRPPGKDHGVDVNEGGEGTITGDRLFQLVRQQASVKDRVFEIEFLDPGAGAFAFTFG